MILRVIVPLKGISMPTARKVIDHSKGEGGGMFKNQLIVFKGKYSIQYEATCKQNF